MAILEQNKRRGAASLRLQFVVAAAAVVALVPLSSLTWAGPQDGATGLAVHVHEHIHIHEVDHEYSESDSANFERHLDALGIDLDDVDALLTGLAAADPMTRGASAWALARSDDPRVVEPLIQAGYDADAVVRQWAIRTLNKWPEARVARMLVDRVQDPDAEVRQWAVRTLNGHDASIRTQPLISALGDPDKEVREWAARSLAGVRNDAAQAAMGSRLGVESSESVSEWLVRSIDPSAPGGVEALVAATVNESAEVRQWAVRGLAGSTNALAVDTMIGMLSDRDDEVREWSVRGLAACGNDRAIAPLQALEQDPNPEVREWAARVIDGIRCAKAQAMR